MAKTIRSKTKRDANAPASRRTPQELADIVTRPTVNAAAVIKEYAKPFGEQDVSALVEQLSESVGKVWDGDMRRCEAMLVSQAHALQSIFMNLARRATTQEYLKQWETYLRMALRAQNQCRATLETLAAIKNPPVVIAKQANIAHGPQQVNNGFPAPECGNFMRAQKTPLTQNELLEAHHGEWMDSRTEGPASVADSAMATVENGNRPAVG